MSDSWPLTASLIPTIKDRGSLLGQFFGLISKVDEYILVADDFLAAQTPAVQARCDVQQRQQTTKKGMIAQGQIDHAMSPSFDFSLRQAHRLSETATSRRRAATPA